MEHSYNQGFKEELKKAKESQSKGYIYKPRKNRTINFNADFENRVKLCAEKFVKYL